MKLMRALLRAERKHRRDGNGLVWVVVIVVVVIAVLVLLVWVTYEIIKALVKMFPPPPPDKDGISHAPPIGSLYHGGIVVHTGSDNVVVRPADVTGNQFSLMIFQENELLPNLADVMTNNCVYSNYFQGMSVQDAVNQLEPLVNQQLQSDAVNLGQPKVFYNTVISNWPAPAPVPTP